jgi:hypothetical protein
VILSNQLIIPKGLTLPSDYLDLDTLDSIINHLNLNDMEPDILIAYSKHDLGICEEYLDRPLLKDTLGQTSYDLNTITINLYAIIEEVKQLKLSQEEQILTISQEFLMTLLHELGHLAIYNGYELPNLIIDQDNYNDEDAVETYAATEFSYLDQTFYIETIWSTPDKLIS